MSFQKRKDLEHRLSQSKTFVIVNSNIEGVILPSFLMGQNSVTLSLCYWFEGREPIEMGEKGVGTILSFNGVKSSVFLPWDSITGLAFPDDDLTTASLYDSLGKIKIDDDDDSLDSFDDDNPTSQSEEGVIDFAEWVKTHKGDKSEEK